MAQVAPFTARDWQGFYVVIGSAAGALTGLQFVVLTLISEAGLIRGSSETLAAFGSPNVFHFCAALLVSAIFSAPWGGLGPPGIAVAVAGAIGFFYSVTVMLRAMRQSDYKPVLEDWTWHAALPLLAYAALIHAGLQLARVSTDAMYIVGGAALLLVFIGIHNAWDTVTYVTMERAREHRARKAESKRAAPETGAAAAAPGSVPTNATAASPDADPPGPPEPRLPHAE